jgi:hypothetical protein
MEGKEGLPIDKIFPTVLIDQVNRYEEKLALLINEM